MVHSGVGWCSFNSRGVLVRKPFGLFDPPFGPLRSFAILFKITKKTDRFSLKTLLTPWVVFFLLKYSKIIFFVEFFFSVNQIWQFKSLIFDPRFFLLKIENWTFTAQDPNWTKITISRLPKNKIKNFKEKMIITLKKKRKKGKKISYRFHIFFTKRLRTNILFNL